MAISVHLRSATSPSDSNSGSGSCPNSPNTSSQFSPGINHLSPFVRKATVTGLDGMSTPRCAMGAVALGTDQLVVCGEWYYLSVPDRPENCHLTVKKLPKTWHFFKKNCAKIFIFFKKNCQWQFFLMKIFGKLMKKMSCFWQFFDTQMAILRRVSSDQVLPL